MGKSHTRAIVRYPVCKHKSHARRESFVGARVITRDHERLRALGGLSGAGFAGFIGIFRMGEYLLTQVGSDERWTRVCERLREFASVYECWADCLEQDLQDFLGFSGWGSTC